MTKVRLQSIRNGGTPKEKLKRFMKNVPVISVPELRGKDSTRKTMMNSELIKEKIIKSCAVCKFAKHDVELDIEELDQIIYTLNPVSPCLKDVDDTCSH